MPIAYQPILQKIDGLTTIERVLKFSLLA